MQVKAQGLLNAAKWIEEEYGRDALGSVVRACSAPVRDRYVSAIAINWHPMEEFVEFVDAADRLLGRGNGKLAEEIGAAGARANMKGTLVRIAVYLAQPDFFFRRVAGLWNQFNDEGEMIVHHLDNHSGAMEVRGVKAPNATFCNVLSGWMRQVAMGIGIETPNVRHTECRCRGDARCYWEGRWVAIHDDAAAAARESINRLPSPESPASSGTTKVAARHSSSAPAASPPSSRNERAASSRNIPSSGVNRAPRTEVRGSEPAGERPSTSPPKRAGSH